MTRSGRLSGACVLCGIYLLAWVSPARAQDIPFAFLIQNGWQAFEQPVTRLDQPIVSWARRGMFYSVVNGTKGTIVGSAGITAWSRSVPDPTYAAIGPVAGVITLEFPTFRGHLGLIDTPTGLQTTIGIVETSGAVNIGVTGSWLLGNGTSVVGGTANDMVVAGIVRFRSIPSTIGAVSIFANQALSDGAVFQRSVAVRERAADDLAWDFSWELLRSGAGAAPVVSTDRHRVHRALQFQQPDGHELEWWELPRAGVRRPRHDGQWSRVSKLHRVWSGANARSIDGLDADLQPWSPGIGHTATIIVPGALMALDGTARSSAPFDQARLPAARSADSR